MKADGWLARQIANSDRNVDEWPTWMRRAAGIPNPEDNALERARTQNETLRGLLERAHYAIERAVTLKVTNHEWFQGEADDIRAVLAAPAIRPAPTEAPQ